MSWRLFVNNSKKYGEHTLHDLPKRSDFVDHEMGMKEKITDRRPVYYMALRAEDYLERFQYKILSIGFMEDGSKAAIIIDNILPYVDVYIPDGVIVDILMECIINMMEVSVETKEIQQWIVQYEKYEVIKRYPFEYFQDYKNSYMRIYFKNHLIRSYWIRYIKSHTFNINGSSMELSTSYDDTPHNYYNKAAAIHNLPLCGWLRLDKYKVSNNRIVLKRPNGEIDNVRYLFKLDPNNITPSNKIEGFIANDIALNPKGIVMTWDLETYSPTHPAIVPSYKRTGGRDKEGDNIFIAGIAFYHMYSTEPLCVISISDSPSDELDYCHTIRVMNEKDLLIAFGHVIERMCPDFVTGYNDMNYDWPFINARLSKYNIFHDFIKRISVIPYNKDGKNYNIRGYVKTSFKIETENFWGEYYDVPTFTCMDTLIRTKQKRPKINNFTLNSVLDVMKLGKKEDMEYIHLAQINRIYREFKANSKIPRKSILTKSGIMNLLDHLMNKYGDIYIFGDPSSNLSKLSCKDKDYEIRKMKLSEIKALMGGIEHGGESTMGLNQVIHYCNVDAMKCQEILVTDGHLKDDISMGQKTFSSYYETVNKAGSFKVSNYVLNEGSKEKWSLTFKHKKGESTENSFSGAYVVIPKKGLYRDHKYEKIARMMGIDPINFRDHLDEIIEYEKQMKCDEHTSLDEMATSDKPTCGLDFKSLYPSLIATYNISPDKYVRPEDVDYYRNKGYEVLEVNFGYGKKGAKDKDRSTKTSHIIQHSHPVRHEIKTYTLELKERYGDEWILHVDKAKCDKWRKELNSTPLEDWIKYGMGVYPIILRRLFDERNQIKKEMHIYDKTIEYIMIYYRNTKISIDDMDDVDNINNIDDKIEYINFIKEKLNSDINTPEYLKAAIYKGLNIIMEYENNSFSYCLETFSVIGEQLNIAQSATKILMNTFYGVMGQELNAFFNVYCAGAVTAKGQNNTKMVEYYVKNIMKQDILYGDTDSLYISPICEAYDKADADYVSGKYSREEYWSKLTEITMKEMKGIQDTTNNLLMLDNTTTFLVMAYEEVLYPMVLLGKKKYAGIQHEDQINFNVCHEKDPMEFLGNGSFFKRGIEAIKRGKSMILKKTMMRTLSRVFNVNNYETLEDVGIDVMHKMFTEDWDPNDCCQNIKYNISKKSTTAIMKFAERMEEVEKHKPQFGIRKPIPGNRVKLIKKKVYAKNYNVNGKQPRNLSVGERYEYYDSIFNEEYQQVYGTIEIDKMDYLSDVVNPIGRLISYKKSRDKYQSYMCDNNDDFKDKDAASVAAIRNELSKIVKQQYGSNVLDLGPEAKEIFDRIIPIYNNNVICGTGLGGLLMKDITISITDAENKGKFDIDIIINKIEEDTETIAKNLSESFNLKDRIKLYESPLEYYKKFWAPGKLYRKLIKIYRRKVEIKKKPLKNLICQVYNIQMKHVEQIKNIRDKYFMKRNIGINSENVHEYKNIPIDEGWFAENIKDMNYNDEDLKIINNYLETREDYISYMNQYMDIKRNWEIIKGVVKGIKNTSDNKRYDKQMRNKLLKQLD